MSIIKNRKAIEIITIIAILFASNSTLSSILAIPQVASSFNDNDITKNQHESSITDNVLQNNIIQEENNIDYFEEEIIECIEIPEIVQEIEQRTVNIYEITEISGFTADEVNKIIDHLTDNDPSSKLAGMGEKMIEAEILYEVNVLWMLVLAKLESNYGRSDLAKYRNNAFGFNGSKGYLWYDTIDDSIDAFARVMRTNYFDKDRTTISTIASKYCPKNIIHWTNLANGIYNDIIHVLFDENFVVHE